jgi:tetratricopeptide (TPR) repeat protein
MSEALTMANVNQYVGYGRILISQKRPDKAVEVLLAAKTKFGDVAAVNNGLMFGYSAKADYKNALIYADKAMAQVPKDNDAAKKTLEGQIAKLKEGKDIN